LGLGGWGGPVGPVGPELEMGRLAAKIFFLMEG